VKSVPREKEYRLRFKHDELAMIVRTLGEHLLTFLPREQWNCTDLALCYHLYDALSSTLSGARGRRISYQHSYSWLKEHKDRILRWIREDLAELPH